jgi:hypothetical protein
MQPDRYRLMVDDLRSTRVDPFKIGVAILPRDIAAATDGDKSRLSRGR